MPEFDAPNEAVKQANAALKEGILGHSLGSSVAEAALWLSLNADTIKGNPLLEVMARFHISVLDAVEASNHAHALRYAGRAVPAS
ncbi:hypothetical protein ACU8MX_18360 [Rhizobium leguminosarum]